MAKPFSIPIVENGVVVGYRHTDNFSDPETIALYGDWEFRAGGGNYLELCQIVDCYVEPIEYPDPNRVVGRRVHRNDGMINLGLRANKVLAGQDRRRRHY